MSEQAPRPDQAPAPAVARPLVCAGLTPPHSELEMTYLGRRDALLDLTLVVLASVVLPYLPGLLTPIEAEGLNLPDVGAIAIVQKWCEASLAMALLLYFVLRQGAKPASFGLRRDRIGSQVLWGFGTLASVYAALLATAGVVLALYLMFPALESDLLKRVEFAEALPVHDLGMTLALLVAVAVHEELVFRGLLLPYLRRVLGSWWSAGLVSALIFAALHVPHQGLLGASIQIFSIALVLAVFFILSRSLLAVILAHLLFDFLQFQLYRLVPDLHKLLENFQA